MRPVQRQSFQSVERLETRLCFSGGAATVHNSIVVGDYNKDGFIDLIASNPGSRNRRANNGVALMLGNGNGTFGKARAIGGQGFAHGAALDVGDFNKDGNLDLVVYGGSNPTTTKKNGHAVNGLLVLLGHGDGTFSKARSIGGTLFHGSTDRSAEPHFQGSIAVGDVDKDGNTDITVSDPDLSSSSTTENGLTDVWFVRNTGNAVFADAVQTATT